MMQKTISGLCIAAAMTSALPFAYLERLRVEDVRVTPHTAVTSAPRVLTVAGPVMAPARVSPTPPAAPTLPPPCARVWTCSAPEGLATDYAATVRRCEWK